MKLLSINTTLYIFIGFLIGSMFNGCGTPKPETLTIAISKESSNYTQWLLRNDAQLNTINLYGMRIDSATKALANCQGLLLTGGEDVYPGYYLKESDTSRCGMFDHYRDSLEMSLINYAIQHKIPIMGICRGEQIINVALGGSLIIDIPHDFDTTVIHRQNDWQRCFHPVNAVQGSLLVEISGADRDNVTSNHHQAIDLLAKELFICAYADDSLPEAVSWKNPEGKGYLFAVQWHPERMKSGSPFSDPLAQQFLKEAALYTQKWNR